MHPGEKKNAAEREGDAKNQAKWTPILLSFHHDVSRGTCIGSHLCLFFRILPALQEKNLWWNSVLPWSRPLLTSTKAQKWLLRWQNSFCLEARSNLKDLEPRAVTACSNIIIPSCCNRWHPPPVPSPCPSSTTRKYSLRIASMIGKWHQVTINLSHTIPHLYMQQPGDPNAMENNEASRNHGFTGFPVYRWQPIRHIADAIEGRALDNFFIGDRWMKDASTRVVSWPFLKDEDFFPRNVHLKKIQIIAVISLYPVFFPLFLAHICHINPFFSGLGRFVEFVVPWSSMLAFLLKLPVTGRFATPNFFMIIQKWYDMTAGPHPKTASGAKTMIICLASFFVAWDSDTAIAYCLFILQCFLTLFNRKSIKGAKIYNYSTTCTSKILHQ